MGQAYTPTFSRAATIRDEEYRITFDPMTKKTDHSAPLDPDNYDSGGSTGFFLL